MEISSLLLTAFVVILIGISKSAFAGALGVFAVPLLMIKFSAVEAITLLLPLLMMADVFSLKSFWKQWNSRLLIILLPGAVVGIAMANILMDRIDSDILRLIIATVCILFAVKNLYFKQLSVKRISSPLGAAVMSATSGITSTLVHAGGPPIIIYFTAIGLAQTQFVATAIAFFAVMNVFKLVGLMSLGLLSWQTVLTALAFVPLTYVGNWMGLAINQRINKQQFLQLMNYLLLLLGGWLAVSGGML